MDAVGEGPRQVAVRVTQRRRRALSALLVVQTGTVTLVKPNADGLATISRRRPAWLTWITWRLAAPMPALSVELKRLRSR